MRDPPFFFQKPADAVVLAIHARLPPPNAWLCSSLFRNDRSASRLSVFRASWNEVIAVQPAIASEIARNRNGWQIRLADCAEQVRCCGAVDR